MNEVSKRGGFWRACVRGGHRSISNVVFQRRAVAHASVCGCKVWRCIKVLAVVLLKVEDPNSAVTVMIETVGRSRHGCGMFPVCVGRRTAAGGDRKGDTL